MDKNKRKFGIIFLYSTIFGFILGVAFYSFFYLGAPFIYFLLLFLGVCFFYYFYRKREPSSGKENEILILLLVFAASFFFGVWRYHIGEVRNDTSIINPYIGQYVLIEGEIATDPDTREDFTFLTIKADTLNNQVEIIEINTRILARTESFPKRFYGQRLKIEGRLVKPKNFNNENDRLFDYVNYLQVRGIYYQLQEPRVTIISQQEKSLKSFLFGVKAAILNKINTLLPEPESALLGGLLVGAKEGLGKDLESQFRTTGLIHIVVLSGFNVAIIAFAITKIFSALPKKIAGITSITAIILFAIMTGADATIVRASIMAILVITAQFLRRPYEIRRALFIAGFFMVLINPKILIFDFSFQLSFLATLGIIYLSPLIEKKIRFITSRFGVRQIISATISTQIFVMPLLLYRVGELSLVSLPANILVLPVIPFAMFSGFLTSIVGHFSDFLSVPLQFLAYLPLTYIIFVTRAFSSFNLASFEIAAFSPLILFLIYLIYALILVKLNVPKTPSVREV